MKQILAKISTTSVIAAALVFACMGLLFVITCTDQPKDDTTRTQIVQGLFGLLMLLGGYYFGASKNRSPGTPPATDTPPPVNN